MLWILGAFALVGLVYALGWYLVHRGNPVLRFLGRHPRLRFVSVVALTVAVGVLGFLFLVYPERLFGVEGGELGSSLARSLKQAEGGNCRPDGSQWRCSVDVGTSEATTKAFELGYDGGACWEATPVEAGKAPDARKGETIKGCVGVLDYVAPRGRDFAED